MAIWEVDLRVDGAVTVAHAITFSQQKGFRPDDAFYSEIEIRRASFGLEATITARAENEELAAKAALFFFGRMLDALILEVDVSLRLTLSNLDSRIRDDINSRRRIEQLTFETAFNEALQLSRENPVFLRSLGWYRKGLSTSDPFDQFLAYWNSIAIVASKYFATCPDVDLERAKKGIINQIWPCFLAVWGSNNKWPLIPGNEKWIDDGNELRNLVAHGGASIDVKYVGELSGQLPLLRQVAHRFLTDWRKSTHFKPERKSEPDEQPYLV